MAVHEGYNGVWSVTKIHVKGFKSIGKQRVTASFPRGLCCIVGPNGSGKSNLLDAICFACGCSAATLGVQRLSALQCTDVQEVRSLRLLHNMHTECLVNVSWAGFLTHPHIEHQVCEVSAEVSNSSDGRTYTVLCSMTASSGRTYKLNGKLKTGTEIKVHMKPVSRIRFCSGSIQ